MKRSVVASVISGLAMTVSASAVSASELVLDRDNIKIEADAVIAPGTYVVEDADDNGVVQITGHNITVDFQNAELVGAPDDRLANAYTGLGIVITGRNVTVRNVRVRGFRVGILASESPKLRIEDVDVSGNFRQRLKSTPQREDLRDWLSPHANDGGEWLANYGAGLAVQRSDAAVIQRVRARRGQNGIVLDRVSDSKIIDNDCSFLSGWGLALWRCNRNQIVRNAFDFCVRGYSHGVYNRGQDSAGILMFEQNNDNVIAQNSATHCGDGFFGFGGSESLAGGERTGNNNNLLIGNDFSYAAAHGIEMTFSFGNRFLANRLVGNAICGIWAGYSQDTLIEANHLEGNGQAGYGAERGGINIEHGSGNVIKHNVFTDNKTGVYLWSDEDRHLASEPWVKANDRGSTDNIIAYNTFDGDEVAVQLRASTNTRHCGNTMRGVGREYDVDESSKMVSIDTPAGRPARRPPPPGGANKLAAGRQRLRGREHIIITEWGPYDFVDREILPPHAAGGDKVMFQVLGPSGRFKVTDISGAVAVTPIAGDLPGLVTVQLADWGVETFRLTVDVNGPSLHASGTLCRLDWDVKFFAWNPASDPRKHQARWDLLLKGPALARLKSPSLDFDWALGSPARSVPPDQFGTLATTSVDVPESGRRWRVRTVSDDGIRVWVGGNLVIDDWEWHPPKENAAILDLPPGRHAIRVEHFEIDGYARLAFRLEPIDESSRAPRE